ncbi:MAG: hypothetical protein EB127_02430 [Alphaproteobacteria bacterium]|nr:hypothetical protein [Alphaproteobacteria bacterium]
MKTDELIKRAGFSSTYEKIRLERLMWLTALEISPMLNDDQWKEVKLLLQIPDDVQQRKNFNYLTKTKQSEDEGYMS